MKTIFRFFSGVLVASTLGLSSVFAEWENVQTIGEPVARHEAAFIEFDDKFYLMGGRRMNPVSIYDPNTKEWSLGAVPPIEVHHFQPVIFEDRVYFICAMTGKFPNETGLERVLTYTPAEDRWEFTHEIPEHRRRGAAGVVVYK
ncbi:MAG: galactose oxidase, partial [Verrucomicrobiota bacterium]